MFSKISYKYLLLCADKLLSTAKLAIKIYNNKWLIMAYNYKIAFSLLRISETSFAYKKW